MADQAPSSGILTLINESLSFQPERADLWMTRFDVLRTMGHKREFAQALDQAVANTRIRKQLDWIQIRAMWADVAPGEPFPTDAEELVARPATPAPVEELLPDLPVESISRFAPKGPPPSAVRRFKDIALKVAGPELAELARAYNAIALKPGFLEDFARKTARLLNRPTPLEYSDSLSRAAGTGMRIYLKREDQRGVSVEAEHAAAQCYIGSLLGKSHVVTGCDVDAHALEVATVAPFFDMKCTIVVRPEDFQDKAPMIADLKALGAQLVPMKKDGMIGTDPREGALRIWQRNTAMCHLALSLGMAPAPHTAMANAFQALVGREAESQYTPMASLLNRPRTLVAAVGSEADSIGFVLPFLNRKDIRVAYAEPEPGGVASWRPSERLKPYNGQVREHAWLRGVGRIQHVPVSDAEASASRERMARDGIEVGLEDARAVALTALLGAGDPTPRDFIVLVG
jgi:tryptophan synthase beta chain